MPAPLAAWTGFSVLAYLCVLAVPAFVVPYDAFYQLRQLRRWLPPWVGVTALYIWLFAVGAVLCTPWPIGPPVHTLFVSLS